MAEVANGKINKNLNVRQETVARIEELKALTFRSNAGDVVDLAIARLYQDAKEGKINLANNQVNCI